MSEHLARPTIIHRPGERGLKQLVTVPVCRECGGVLYRTQPRTAPGAWRHVPKLMHVRFAGERAYRRDFQGRRWVRIAADIARLSVEEGRAVEVRS